MPNSGSAVLKNLSHSFFTSGGTKLGSQVYCWNVNPWLLHAYLPKEKHLHEQCDTKVDDNDIDTKKLPTAPSVKEEPAKSGNGASDNDRSEEKLEDVVFGSE